MSRIDLAGGFTPENVRILPKHEQVGHACRQNPRLPPPRRGCLHPRAKAVCTPLGLFGSVADAAAAHGISRDAAARRSRGEREGWRYLDRAVGRD
jgi:hypothetical protein